MNLPNRITCVRLILIPFFTFFYMADFIPYGKLVATILFIIACLSDFLDGHIARKRNLVTTVGKFLDSIADKILVMAGLLLLVAWPVTANGGEGTSLPIIFPQYVGVIMAIIILAREFIISAFRQLAASKGVVMAADIYGKIKAVFQFITLIYYFLYAFIVEKFYYAIEGVPNTVICLVGYILIAITVIMTIISAGKYISGNKKVFKDEK